jgi:predicted adenine nucleotide alpha hydrolase (AANH) superfamily ATPase
LQIMKILLHSCCAPCLIYPLKMLIQDEHEITGCFYNPNIHPCREYQRRLEALRDYAVQQNLEVLWPEGYDMENFLRSVAFREADRCYACYDIRLRYAASMAKGRAFDGFTTTLLYSKYQKHDLIRSIGETLAKEYGISFYYRDFRVGWSEGVRISRETGMYRQAYCGCIYSEKERYWAAPTG